MLVSAVAMHRSSSRWRLAIRTRCRSGSATLVAMMESADL
jgi:hypothetical protein